MDWLGQRTNDGADPLTDDEIEAVSARIVDKVAKATGGVLRG